MTAYARGRRDMLRQVIRWVEAAESDHRRTVCETTEDRLRFTGGMLACRGLAAALRKRLDQEKREAVCPGVSTAESAVVRKPR